MSKKLEINGKKVMCFTTEETAQKTGLTSTSLHIYSKRYGVGHKDGWLWYYSADDIKVIKSHMRKG